ncbi:hypothetical protein [Halosimplex marinum]|uniref:hypothetical protein n=1 Tax=Halosimplex marinum TaxID=3396620 RepID=UPI003F56492B
MATDTTGSAESATAPVRTWLVLAALFGALVGLPALVLAETEFGALSDVGVFAALGVPRALALGAVALVPGFALGGLSVVAMTGWE